MSLGLNAYRYLVGSMLNHPTKTAGGVIFTLGFALVAGNAVWSQQQVHPDPIWNTADSNSVHYASETDHTITRSVIDAASVVPQPKPHAHNVLTQRISLKNLPVPVMRPEEKTEKGASPEAVREFQELLASLGLYEGKVDGIYGRGTKSAIVAFQDSARILPDGKPSYELLANLRATVSASQRINAAKTIQQEAVQQQAMRQKPAAQPIVHQAVVEKPSKYQVEHVKAASKDFDSQTIRRIQTGLKEKFGIEEIDVDGVFGSQTREALKQFQAFFQLNESGEIDRITLEKLVSSGIITAI